MHAKRVGAKMSLATSNLRFSLTTFESKTYNLIPNSRWTISNRELLPTPREMASSILY
jgi:hypothetical protein